MRLWGHLYVQEVACIPLPGSRTAGLTRHARYPWDGEVVPPDNAWENRFYCTLVPCLESPRGRPVEVTAIAVAPRPRDGGGQCEE